MELSQRVTRGAAIGAIAGFVIVAVLTVGSPGSTIAGTLWLPLVLAAAGALLVISTEGAQPYHINEWTPLPAAAIRRHAIRSFALNGWMLRSDDGRVLSFSRNTLNLQDLGCLVLVSGLLAFIYLLGRTNLSATIVLSPVPDGTEVEIIVNTRGGGGQVAAVGFFNSLHQLT